MTINDRIKRVQDRFLAAYPNPKTKLRKAWHKMMIELQNPLPAFTHIAVIRDKEHARLLTVIEREVLTKGERDDKTYTEQGAKKRAYKSESGST